VRMAEMKEDFERLWVGTVMRRAIYPTLVAKGLVLLVPDGCLEVMGEEPDLLLGFVVYERMGLFSPEGCIEALLGRFGRERYR